MWLSQPFYVAHHMIWEFANARRASSFLLLGNTDINTYTLYKCKGKQSQKIKFNKTKIL
jgi:hypothetical protein